MNNCQNKIGNSGHVNKPIIIFGMQIRNSIWNIEMLFIHSKVQLIIYLDSNEDYSHLEAWYYY